MKSLILTGLAVLAIASGIQAKGDDTGKDVKRKYDLWVLEIGGIGGWSAAAQAATARDAVKRVKGVKSAFVDTTARGFIKVAAGSQPSKADIVKALGKRRFTLTKFEKTKLGAPVAIFDIKVDGLAWQGTANSIRAMLEKLPNVAVAMPFNDTKTVEVWIMGKNKLDVKSTQSLINADERFTVKAFTKRPMKKSPKIDS